jgi:F-type H+-transporting ATPase subunit delta
LKGRTAARRYAKALLDLAKRDDAIADIGAQLRQYQTLLRTHGDLQVVLEHPGVDSQAKANILTAIIERTNPAPLLRNFLLLLLENDRLRQLDLIYDHYERLANEELQRVVAQVTTAVELDPEERRAVTQKIAHMTHKEVILETHVDPSLLGGLVVRVNNTILDGSLRGQLARMRQELIGG